MTRTVLITGAGSGIGRALAKAHLARGDQVYGLDLDLDPMEDLQADGLLPRRQDVSDTAGLRQACHEIWTASGGIDWVYANAGVPAAGRLTDVSEADFEACFSVNVLAVWATLQACAQLMIKEARAGRLCLTASEHALGFQHAGAGIYTASKHAVLGLADVWRRELPDEVKMSVLCPGLTNTSIGLAGDGPPAAQAFGQAMMAEGLSPEIVAEATIEGVERGDFIIATHAASRLGWQARQDDVEAAFAHVPAAGQNVNLFAVPSVIRRVRAKLQGGA
ncbi:MAG: SDR family NAD(P)-dependent oxidoreductase [Pseudomonadota bacterium]